MSGRFAIVFLFLLCMAGCSAPEKPVIPAGRFPDAAAYNDFILGLQDSLTGISAALSDRIGEGNRKEALELTKRFKARCRQVVDTLLALQDWKDDSTLRVAAIRLFEVYEESASKYPAMFTILFTEDAVDTTRVTDTIPLNDTSDPNAALIPRYEQLQRKISRQEEEARLHFFEVQKEFARRFAVKLAVSGAGGGGED